MKESKSIEFVTEHAMYPKIIGLSKNLRRDFQRSSPNIASKASPLDIFHLYRRFKIDQTHFLSRIGFIIDEKFKIHLRNPPEIAILPSVIRTLTSLTESVFMSLNIWDGIVSANEWSEKGIEVMGLGKIYPLYSVWPPTGKEYLRIFNEYLENTVVKGTGVDLGCGAGVLGMILAKKGMTVFGVDNNFQAAKSSNLNAQALGVDFSAVHGDAAQINIPNCDVLVCNPPWIPAAPSSLLDSGNYDYKEQLLQAAFMQTKKLNAGGRFILIYSNIAERIGLQAPGKIQDLCKKHDLVVKEMITTEFPVTADTTHPLKSIRDGSSISLYEIVRL